MINGVSSACRGSYPAPRGVATGQDGAFAAILKDKQQKKLEAKEYLQTLSAGELSVLQSEQRLASAINIKKLSSEGAENLFVAWCDRKHLKDLNNDGIVEIGEGKSFVFPPANAPDAVKEAWEKTVANMTLGERLRAEAPFLVAQLTANIRSMPDGSTKVMEPGDEGYKNAFEGSVDFYRGMMNSLKNKHEKDLKSANSEARHNIEFGLKVISQFLENLGSIS